MIHSSERKHTMRFSDKVIRYWTYGTPSKPILILVHGITGTHRGFYKIIPFLTNDFFIIAPDLPGFGESTTQQPLSIARHAETLNHFIEKLKLRRLPYVIGHSYGTLVVTQAAYLAPELSQPRLILISPVPSAISLFEKRHFGKIAGELHYAVGRIGRVGAWWLRRKTIARFITHTLITTKDHSLRKEIHQEHFDNLKYIQNPTQLYRLFKEVHRTGINIVANHIEKKVLIITGTHDVSAPFIEQEKVHQQFKDSILLPLQGAGHLSHYELPRSLALAIKRYLQTSS